MSLHELTLDQLGSVARGRSRHRPRDAAFLYGGPYPFIQTGDGLKAAWIDHGGGLTAMGGRGRASLAAAGRFHSSFI